MMTQTQTDTRAQELDLFHQANRPTSPLSEEPPTIEERFEAFHDANPAVYAELRQMARKAKSMGFARYSIKALMEVLRWNRSVEVVRAAAEPFKVNNDFTSRYARLLMERDPDLKDFFATREIKTD